MKRYIRNLYHPFLIIFRYRLLINEFLQRRHNEIRDITSSLLYNVSIEPPLLPLTGEQLTLNSSVTLAEARLDTRGWNPLQDAFFDVHIFHQNAPSYINTDQSSRPQL